jgi:hypothetical protein
LKLLTCSLESPVTDLEYLQMHYDHLAVRCRYPAPDENARELRRQRAALGRVIEDRRHGIHVVTVIVSHAGIPSQ